MSPATLISLPMIFGALFQTAELTTEIEADLQAIRAAYVELDNYSIDVTYTEFDAYSKGNVLSVNKGTFLRKGKNYRMSLPGQSTICKNGLVVVKSEGGKLVLVANDQNSSGSPFTEMSVENILKISVSYEKLETVKAGQAGYKFEFVGGSYEYLDLIYDKKNHLLTKVIVYGRSLDKNGKPVDGRLEIHYTGLKMNQAISDKLFSTSDILQYRDGEYKLNPNLIGYKLIDQTN